MAAFRMIDELGDNVIGEELHKMMK
jgi:hypothetical protein